MSAHAHLDENFLQGIESFPQELRDLVIKSYHEVVAKIPARREAMRKGYTYNPANCIQRCPKNSYFTGYFIVFWDDDVPVLYHPEDILKRYLAAQTKNE